MSGVWFALGLTLVAGMATGIGSAIAFTAKRTNYRFLSVSTGFSAGVMLYVSFVEIFFKGNSALAASYGDRVGYWVNTAAFFGGMLLIGIIDNLIPAAGNPHETHAEAVTAPLHDAAAPIPTVEHARRATDSTSRTIPHPAIASRIPIQSLWTIHIGTPIASPSAKNGPIGNR